LQCALFSLFHTEKTNLYTSVLPPFSRAAQNWKCVVYRHHMAEASHLRSQHSAVLKSGMRRKQVILTGSLRVKRGRFCVTF
jgi:outer membrane protein assembly factor BamE (lipoprotein component of BamABCDE complex)